MKNIFGGLNKFGDNIGFYYKDITKGFTYGINEDKALMAASVIKLAVITEVFKQMELKNIDRNTIIEIKKDDKLPSSGALAYMHDGLKVTIEDLYTLMIIHSDNTATNILIKMVGIDNINKTMCDIGLKNTKINRLLFDARASKEGKENYVSAKDMAILLEKIFNRELISEKASLEIEKILQMQRINGKIPYLLPKGTIVGHKTGEDTGITNDVGIVYGEKPFIICFLSNNVDIIKAEEAIRETTYNLHRFTI